MKNYNEIHQEILLRIMELSTGAPVVVSIGFVKDQFCHKGLVIKSAPSSVVKAIINDERVFTAHMEPDGLHISPYPCAERRED